MSSSASAGRSDSRPGASTAEREVLGMLKIIKKDRQDRERAIIAVVRPESIAQLEERTGPSRLKFWRGKTPVRVTSSDNLQATIDEMMHKRARHSASSHLSILVSKRIDSIHFDVPADVQTLSILRGSYETTQKTKQKPAAHSVLLVEGSSTFASVRLDSWQGEENAKQHSKHELYLGDGICIAVDMAPGTAWADSGPLARISQTDKTTIYESISRMYDMDIVAGPGVGPSGPVAVVGEDMPWWVKWKEPLAAILGIVKGDGKSAAGIKASHKGLYVQFQFGEEAMQTVEKGIAVATAVSGVLSAAGPIVGAITSAPGVRQVAINALSAAGPVALLSMGVGAAIYFVPWQGLFGWLKGIFARLWEKICSLWKRLMDFVRRKLFGTGEGKLTEGESADAVPLKMNKHRPPPILF
ncbi:uncharacterized protein BCR38DRAFT_519735 [Pseudomassariella vexata]|uniref:Uncharacterized protein n=1 Tax=Pseudomassariella vexata TaxID=1141098 RepID=A0A1Y2EJ75_9PEZI|nr:uncharacterized protein BCR38DRAFT_519735 [Pseudomassariella vexata]ORY71306.1 hypothetical protein BCR38DRAFT_519735 [Pseudomassariella vexata]